MKGNWELDPKGQFLVKSFHDVLHGGHLREEGWTRYWNKLVPPRILVYYWLARLQKLLMMNNLAKIRHYWKWVSFVPG